MAERAKISIGVIGSDDDAGGGAWQASSGRAGKPTKRSCPMKLMTVIGVAVALLLNVAAAGSALAGIGTSPGKTSPGGSKGR